MESTEAESVKLFSNTYLAMRVAFFNELDTFAMAKGLNAQNIIEGLCEDSRIGKGYNNPSFGYGGYCLPKDTRQLLHNFEEVPQSLIRATITSNEKRIKVIAKNIKKTKHKVIGFYKLTMKSNSDNLRSSSSVEVLKEYIKITNNKKIIIYEPLLNQGTFLGCHVINNLDNFINDADLVISNRNEPLLTKKNINIFSRDIYNIDD
jgi:UDPglucose 6-dehydrogenase